MSELKHAIKVLHARKDMAYGAAWKRRGERISVIPNIARKVDRLTTFLANQSTLAEESVFDTAVDLYVYCLKYVLFLAEQNNYLEARLTGISTARPLTDVSSNFDQLVDAGACDQSGNDEPQVLIGKISELFEALWPSVEADASAERRFAFAVGLSDAACRLIGRLAADSPATAKLFVDAELR